MRLQQLKINDRSMGNADNINNSVFINFFIPPTPLNDNLLVPDYANSVNLSMSASQEKKYIPPKNGYIFLSGYGSENSYFSFSCKEVSLLSQCTSNNYVSISAPVAKGVEVTLTSNGITSNRKTYFVPSK